jgi:flagellar basal body rod protein FlgC
MGNVYDIAATGLAAAGLRLDASAHDVANALTDGFTPTRVDAEALPGGGAVAHVTSEAEVRADRALLAGSGVDLAAEAMDQIRASASLRANLAVLRTAEELDEALLGLVH